MRRVVLSLSVRLAYAGGALAMLALKMSSWASGVAPTRKPPMRIEPEQLPAPRPVMALPPPHVLDTARGFMAVNDQNQVKICRGSKKGCDGRADQLACADCYAVMWHDKRPSAEILAAMERGDG